MNNVRLAVEQEITIRCGGYVFKDMITLAERHEQGVPAKAPEDVYKYIEVDLNTIKFTPPVTRDWKGSQKAYSPEDMYMLSSAQAVSHGRIVTNEYFIAIRTGFEGCTCCATTP